MAAPAFRFGLYVSNDLDFIATGLESNRKIAGVLAEIGFSQDKPGSRYFTHPDSELAIEFPSGPLAVGNEQLSSEQAESIQTTQGALKLLSPTDCVKDRLAGYYAWGDEQNFDQAVLVASRQGVRWDDLAKWHKDEGEESGFKAFRFAVESFRA